MNYKEVVIYLLNYVIDFFHNFLSVVHKRESGQELSIHLKFLLMCLNYLVQGKCMLSLAWQYWHISTILVDFVAM